MTRSIELSVVIPVYNGLTVIESTVRRWTQVLAGFTAEIIVIDDGSIDGTREILDSLVQEGIFSGLRVIHQANAGHGPAVVRGYREARGAWIFQADSDNEVEPGYFVRLWERREPADLVLGRRTNRRENWLRRMSTGLIPLAMLPWSHHILHDINVPFRLIRNEVLEALLQRMPQNPFAPNALLSILAVRLGYRVVSTRVPHHHDENSGRSLAGGKFFRALAQASRDLAALNFSTGKV